LFLFNTCIFFKYLINKDETSLLPFIKKKMIVHCCGKGDQSFIHWIFECSTFSLYRCKSLGFIDDLFIIFADKVRNLSLLSSYSNIFRIMKNFINKYIFIFLPGGISALDELQFDNGERRHLSKQLLKSSQGSTVQYIVGLAEYLANTILIISSSLELLFKRLSKNTFITKSVDAVYKENSAIRSSINSHQYTFTNSTVPSTEPIVNNSIFDNLGTI